MLEATVRAELEAQAMANQQLPAATAVRQGFVGVAVALAMTVGVMVLGGPMTGRVAAAEGGGAAAVSGSNAMAAKDGGAAVATPTLETTLGTTGEHKPSFAGTFLQLDSVNAAWSAEQWDQEFASMKKLGMNLLIVQWSATPGTSYYPESTSSDAPAGQPLDQIMRAAEKYQFKVFLGTYLDEAWWRNYMKESFLAEQLVQTHRVAADLAKLYAHSPAFAGWYVPYEIYATPALLPAARRRAAEMLRRVVQQFDELTPGRPVAISPFFDRWLPLGMFESWWRQVLTGSGVDIVFLQDGCGTGRKISPERAGQYFAAMRRAVEAANAENGGQRISLWSDLEIFVEGSWSPAPWERVNAQIQAEAPYVEGFVVFEFNHYMSPVRAGGASGPALELYSAYERYLTSGN